MCRLPAMSADRPAVSDGRPVVSHTQSLFAKLLLDSCLCIVFFIYIIYSACYYNRSRGFGFITFASVESINKALSDQPHVIDNRQVDPKRATPREVCSLLLIIL